MRMSTRAQVLDGHGMAGYLQSQHARQDIFRAFAETGHVCHLATRPRLVRAANVQFHTRLAQDPLPRRRVCALPKITSMIPRSLELPITTLTCATDGPVQANLVVPIDSSPQNSKSYRCVAYDRFTYVMLSHVDLDTIEFLEH